MKSRFCAYAGPVILGLVWTVPGLAKERYQEDLHQRYPLTEQGELRLDNINGKVRITTWDKGEVQVDAVKYASRHEDLAEVKIEIEAKSDKISIHTKYPGTKSSRRQKSNSATVDYELKVPGLTQLDGIETVNGKVEIDGVRGPVRVSTVNGQITAKGLAADCKMDGVNGSMEVGFENLANAKTIALHTVNGKIDLQLPANPDATVSGSTLNGRIQGDKGLTPKKNWPVGHELRGTLGKGSTQVKLESVNGTIRVKVAAGQGQQALAEDPG